VILAAYRSGELDLEEAQAFTLSDDHAEQERIFSELKDYGLHAQYPIFALEHGLNESERAELTRLLHSHLAGQQRPYPYWLLWAVYATEQG